jgi:hypothetical protein
VNEEPLDAAELLRALDLPPEAIPLFLDHIEAFCAAHGGQRHYVELMTLVQRYRAKEA